MPNLILIAGCNGAGKSTFASSFLPDRLTSFDYDKLYLEYYSILPDSEFRDKFARDKTTKDFEDAIKQSITIKQIFVTKRILIPIRFIGLSILKNMDSRSI